MTLAVLHGQRQFECALMLHSEDCWQNRHVTLEEEPQKGKLLMDDI